MKQLLFDSGIAEKDLFLCHTGADTPWVEMIVARIEEQPYRGRRLAVVFDKWDFGKGSNIILNAENVGIDR